MSDYPHLEGSSFADYAKKAMGTEEGLQEEIDSASQQQEERITSTPNVDWETRYKDLEQHNSRQAQELGTLRNENGRYKDAFDDYLLNPTTTEEPSVQPDPITSDDLFERPEEAINQAVDNHPAIREAKEANEHRRQQVILDNKASFEQKHPTYQETMSNPEFAEWIKQSSTRIDLAQRSDQWDFGAADALFSLYESEQALNGITAEQHATQALENATLESAGIGEPPPEAKFSRHDMRETMIAARRGDVKAERYLELNLPKYRAALAAGQVTD